MISHNQTTGKAEAGPNDSKDVQEVAEHLNQMMDILDWFFKRGINVSLHTTPKGYKIKIFK